MMTGLTAMIILAAVCWTFRLSFIVALPASRLPAAVTEGLGHLGPAVLAALVAVEIQGLMHAGNGTADLAVLTTAVAVAVCGYLSRSLAVSTAVGLAGLLVIDLLLR